MILQDSPLQHIVIWLGNTVSAAAIVAALWGLIPVLAALAALVWYVIQIYESRRVQHWLRMRRAQHLVELRAQVESLEVKLREHELGEERHVQDDQRDKDSRSIRHERDVRDDS